MSVYDSKRVIVNSSMRSSIFGSKCKNLSLLSQTTIHIAHGTGVGIKTCFYVIFMYFLSEMTTIRVWRGTWFTVTFKHSVWSTEGFLINQNPRYLLVFHMIFKKFIIAPFHMCYIDGHNSKKKDMLKCPNCQRQPCLLFLINWSNILSSPPLRH